MERAARLASARVEALAGTLRKRPRERVAQRGAGRRERPE